MFPLLNGRVPPFEESLDWLQFDYTTDRKGYYVAPTLTFLVHYVLVEGDTPFLNHFQHLRKRYPRD